MTNLEDDADSKAAKAYNYGVVAGLELAKSIVLNTGDRWSEEVAGALNEIEANIDDLLKAFLEGK